MAVNLLERDQFLRTLDDSLHQAAEGNGRIALISGEAGIGKTSLVETFLEKHQSATRSLWGACEALFTPRPLGPLYDIAQQTQSSLVALLDGELSRSALFVAVLDELARGLAPTIVVFEDVHWADDATLDLIKFLARRVHRTRILLILTHRDDLSKDHPLRLVLGDLPARDVTRLWLPPLSSEAVATLAKKAKRSDEQLHAITGGNPFFLTEVLASDAPGVPTSVSDAVLAQVARRSPEAQSLLELIAVVPSKLSWEAITTISAAHGDVLNDCLATGLLHLDGDLIGYRHELARQAVESMLTPTHRRALHTAILRALLTRGIEHTPLAQLVHHATQAEDGALVLRFAPMAARQAAAQGAHRAAAAHYRQALTYIDLIEEEERVEVQAELLGSLATECSLISQMDDAFQARTAALTLWRSLGRDDHVGLSLYRLSGITWHLGRNQESERYAAASVELLETLPPSCVLAMSYANLASLRMVVSDTPQTLIWGRRAIELAEQFHDPETMCYALNLIGTTKLCSGDESGQIELEQGLQMALEHGYEDLVAHAYTNLANTRVRNRAYARATGYLEDGLAYCAEHDLDISAHSMLGDRARTHLDQGDWVGASEDATAVLSTPWTSIANRIPALIVLGLVRMRRGDPDAESVLDEARDLARGTGEMQCITPVAAARAEWRWLQGNHEQCAEEAIEGFQVASSCKRPWYLGEVAIWLWRGGGLPDSYAEIAPPFAAEVAGDWQSASAQWERIGCPYEQALALADGDELAQRQALVIFERLGARPAIEILRRQLRMAGVRGLPRGPRSATQDNPYKLTNRQLEILLLLAEGLRNPEIAERLSTTPKTVEHHVSAVLAKLEARSRMDAVRVAYQLGLVSQKVANKIGE